MSMRNLARSIPIGVALFLGLATAEADPPARVGRLSFVQGEVAVHDIRTGESEAATLNWPVTSDTAIVTARGARAEVRIGTTAVRLEGATDLEFVQLDDQAILLRLREGTVNVRVRDRETAAQFTLDTPQSQTLLLDTGRYRFDASPGAGTTTVTTFQGNAQVAFGGTAVSVSSGKRAEIGPQGGAEIVGAFADGFDDWALARDRSDDVARSTRYVSPEMTGAESLDEHGDWRETPDYGAVWVPRAVPVGWAPYRSGRWAWIEPWGWTWVDAAPWGFAPFHYGRWALIGGVWAWAPGVFVARPVFAPALVGWIGSPGWSVTVSIGAVPAVGWFPLAPREVFVPAYRCSTVYVRNVNITHVTNIVHAPRPQYAHRHVDRAVTVVPASAVTHGQPVGRSLVRARHADLAVAAAPPETVARPPRRGSDGRARDDERSPTRPREAARPAPNQGAPAARTVTPPPGDRRPIADRSPREERDRRGESPQGRPEPRGVEHGVVRAAPAPQPTPNVAPPPARPTGERPVERVAPIAQPAPGVAVPPTPRAPERAVERRPAVAVRPDASPRADRAPITDQNRAGEPPRRLERRPEPTRVERPVEPARAHAPAPQVGTRVPAPELRREAPAQAPSATTRVAPTSPRAMLPQRSFPEPAESRGDGGRSDARESRGGEWRGGESRGGESRGGERRSGERR
jgi:hypothetical protein